MGAVVACATCGTELRENARLCDCCGSAVEASPRLAEDKQVTVLFTDVVHSMDMAKAVGAERLPEIMAGLPDPGYVLHGLPPLRMRALLARAQVDEDGYRDYRNRYRKLATDLGFEGHTQWAEAMT